ncbi:MAG: hypothetical protein KJ607_00540 [Bacteroidetes bacterium]|nr:hypothetical protein [Bacteroidota bacterium]
MIRFTICILYILTSVLLLNSCGKPEVYPIEPSITFESIYLNDTIDLLGNEGKVPVLQFSFIDGDGDIGLLDSDTTGIYDSDSLYHYNLFLTLYKKVNGEFIELTDLDPPYYYRIPYLGREGTNRALKGDVYVDMLPLYYDTVKMDFYIVDRMLHKSNVATTSELPLK